MYLPGAPAGALTPLGDLHNYQPPAAPFTPTFQLPEEAPPEQKDRCNCTIAAGPETTATAAQPAILPEAEAADPQGEAAWEEHGAVGLPEVREEAVEPETTEAAGAQAGRKAASGAPGAGLPAVEGAGEGDVAANDSRPAGNAQGPVTVGSRLTSMGAHPGQHGQFSSTEGEGVLEPCEGAAANGRGYASLLVPDQQLPPAQKGMAGVECTALAKDVSGQQAHGKGLVQQLGTEVNAAPSDAAEAQEAAANDGVAGDGKFDETTQQYCIYTRRR